MAGIDTDQEVDDFQETTADLGPVPGRFTGSDIRTWAPEIFQIILDELGWTDDELTSWKYVGAIGACTQVSLDTSIDAIKGLPIERLSDLRSSLRRLNLGIHPVFGELVIDIGAAPDPGFPTKSNRFKRIQALLPEWCSAVGSGSPFEPMVTSNVVSDLGVAYSGLFFPGDYFEDAIRWAVATAHAHVDFLFEATLQANDMALPNVDSGVLDFTRTPFCEYSREMIEDFLERFQVVLADADGDPSCRAPDRIVNLSSEAVLGASAVEKVSSGGTMHYIEPSQPGGEGIHVCGSSINKAVFADYHFWWATTLYNVAQDCDSPWAMLLAALAARQGLAYILRLAGSLMHEIGHHDRLGHCQWGCCQHTVEHYFLHRIFAHYGCPWIIGSSPESFAVEKWSVTAIGNGGCGGDKFSVSGRHCKLLKMQHSFKVRARFESTGEVTPLVGKSPWTEDPLLDEFGTTEAGCMPGTVTGYSYPMVAEALVLAPEGGSCFSSR